MESFVTLLFLLFSLALLSVFWLLPSASLRRLKSNGFLGPSPNFPFGNLMEMRQTSKTSSSSTTTTTTTTIGNHDIHSVVLPYFARWKKLYGKVFVYWLGTEPFLYVAEPEFLKQIVSGVLSKSWGKPSVFRQDRRPMFGNGLVMVDGDYWQHHRHIITPAFSPANLNGMVSLMVESTTSMIDEWSKRVRSGESEIDVEKYIIRNAAEIIAKTSFGISEDEGKIVFEKLQAMQTMLFKSQRFVGVPFSKLLSPMKSYEAWKLGKEIDHLLLSIIKSRKENELAYGTSTTHQDLLGILLARNQENTGRERKLTARELVDECKTFFFGGHETTALALTWTLFLLALYPQWQDILRDEIIEVFNGDHHSLDSTILSKLTKMGWVLNEVLRLYSPAPNVTRQAIKDIKVGNKMVIPKGTNMWIDVVAMHHDEELWGDDVNEFRPERFKESNNGGCKHRMGYLPFGFGGRLCVGRNLTMMEYKIVLTLLLSKFSFKVSPSYLHCPRYMLSLRPSHGVPLILEPIQ
ncbi:cytokinin hydroxylase-like [Dioscorea cayenensis subsp. rotundata]|uniref:Cytokinin hydroxylase-like n=1 Tax=Dioscorea cayennensis subsp. rotundata TaxID=55577 RepID=A0AB40ASY6_DIOCR|nr:cytokinin hydroxylase-like [Dioscorea cayenensis subsp. rotundata]